MEAKKLNELLDLAAKEDDFDKAYDLIMKAIRYKGRGYLVILPNTDEVKAILNDFKIEISREIGRWLLVDFKNYNEVYDDFMQRYEALYI